MVPNGNCRHGSESGGVVNEEYVLKRHNDVMSEFVLSDDFCNDLRVNISLRFHRRPSQYIIETPVTADLPCDGLKFCVRKG